jgi:hypothetical protein
MLEANAHYGRLARMFEWINIDGCDRQLDPVVLDRIIAKIPIDG